jgi:hypothetical protein
LQNLLKIIDDLVKKITHPDQDNVSSNLIEEWIILAENYKTEFQEQLLSRILAYQTEIEAKRSVRFLQLRLTTISNKLFNSKTSSTKHTTQPLNLSKVTKCLLSTLEDLNEIIEKSVPEYIDKDMEITEKQKSDFTINFNNTSSRLTKQLQAIDHNLLDLILQPFHEAIHEQKTGLTYRKVNYLNGLLQELSKPIVSGPEKIIQNVKERLIYLNFNSWRFLYYLADEIKRENRKEENLTDKILNYYNQLKCINQTFIKPKVALYPDGNTLKEMFVDWITEEIYVLEKEHQYNCSNETDKKQFVSGGIKLPINLSVPQLAYITRIFVKIGLIGNIKLIDLLDFLSINMLTKKAENLSAKNLNNHYYAPDDKSTAVVKTYMIEAINEINKS